MVNVQNKKLHNASAVVIQNKFGGLGIAPPSLGWRWHALAEIYSYRDRQRHRIIHIGYECCLAEKLFCLTKIV